MTTHCTCESCNSVFHIRYEEEEVEETPGFCPFCGEKLFLDEEFVFMTEDHNEIEDLDMTFDEDEDDLDT